MYYQLLSCDLDDTLFGSDLRVSPANRAAVARLSAAGIRMCINTGRFYSTALPFARELGLEGLMGLCQGAAVVHAPTREVVRTFPVAYNTARELLVYAEENGILAQYYTVDDFFHDRKNAMTDLYERLANRQGVLVERPLYKTLSFDPIKVLYLADEETIARTYGLMRQRYAGALEITVSRPNYLEFNHPDATKGRALSFMADYYGIPMERTAAMGDANNDISMLRAASLGIAMGGSSPAVCRAADAITRSCQEDGFAHAVDTYLLKDEPYAAI